MVFIVELDYLSPKTFFDHVVYDNGSCKSVGPVRLTFSLSNRLFWIFLGIVPTGYCQVLRWRNLISNSFFWMFFCARNTSWVFWGSWFIWWLDIVNYFFVEIITIFKLFVTILAAKSTRWYKIIRFSLIFWYYFWFDNIFRSLSMLLSFWLFKLFTLDLLAM